MRGTSHYEYALAAFHEALELTDPEADSHYYGVILHDIGDVRDAEGRLEQAIAAYRESAEYKRRGNNPSSLATTLNVLADHLIEANGFAEAQVILDEIELLLTEKVGDLDNARRAYLYLELGSAYLRAGAQGHDSNTKALAAYHQAVRLLDHETDAGSYAAVWRRIGDVYEGQGRMEEAIEAYREAAERLRNAADPGPRAGVLVRLGRAELKRANAR